MLLSCDDKDWHTIYNRMRTYFNIGLTDHLDKFDSPRLMQEFIREIIKLEPLNLGKEFQFIFIFRDVLIKNGLYNKPTAHLISEWLLDLEDLCFPIDDEYNGN